jgi:hypothetical protein
LVWLHIGEQVEDIMSSENASFRELKLVEREDLVLEVLIGRFFQRWNGSISGRQRRGAVISRGDEEFAPIDKFQ